MAISNVAGNTNANGNYFVKKVVGSTTQFQLYSDVALTIAVVGNAGIREVALGSQVALLRQPPMPLPFESRPPARMV